MLRRVPHCSHWGAYTLVMDGQRIVAVEPYPDDPSPSPLLGAVKDWVDPDHRVTVPHIRRGWLEKRHESDGSGRGRDDFVPVSWDEALALVSGEIGRVRDRYGNAAIFAGSYGWTSCGRFHHASTLLRRMLNLTGGYTGHVDTYSLGAGPVILRHTLGSDDACHGLSTTWTSIAEHAETLVAFGALASRTAQIDSGGVDRHSMESYLRRMAQRGVKVVLVSPVRNDIPEWVDAEWWPIRPNTDAALMLGLAGEIVARGAHDRAFLDRCTSGADMLLAYLSGEADGKVKDAAWAAGVTGLPAADISRLAARLQATRSMLTVSWGLQRARHGEQPYWAALALAAVLGQIGLPGGGVGYGYGSVSGIGALVGAARSPSMSQLQKPNPDFIPVARIADMLLDPGAPFTYQGRTHAFPHIRMIYWAGGNPFHHHQDLNRFRRAWARPETIVVQDPFWTPTARRADIVLPVCSTLERNDIAGTKRMEVVLAMHKALDPIGQSRSEFDIFRALSARLGVEDAFTEGRDEMQWLRHIYAQVRADAQAGAGFEMPDFDAFWEAGSARVPFEREVVYLAGFRADPQAHPLATESGRIVLGSRTLAALGYDDCPAHPAWLEPEEWLGASAAGEGALHLISQQPPTRLHSQLDFSAVSAGNKRDGRERARLNAADAAARGIGQGDTVRLWNARGQCLASADVVEEVRPGVIVLPTGAWYRPQRGANDEDMPLELAGNPNVLTRDIGSSRFSQGCSAQSCLVFVERYEAQ